MLAVLLLCACGGADPGSVDPAAAAAGDGTAIDLGVSPAEASVLPGGKVQLTTTSSTEGALTWTAVDGGTVTSTGLYTAPSDPGTYLVEASSSSSTESVTSAYSKSSLTSSQNNGRAYGRSKITVTNPPVAVSVTPSSASAQAGGTVTLSATVANATNTTVTWSVKEGASGGSVTSAGAYGAPATSGTYHVVATSVADPTKSGTSTISVSSPPPAAPGVTVSVTPSSAAVGVGGTASFTATVANVTNTAVTWAVQEAGGGSVTASGAYTAPSTAGTYHVVATSVADTTKSATATVTVSAPPVAVSVSPITASVSTGATVAFTASVANTTNQAVTWSVQEGTAGGSVTGTGVYSAPSSGGTYHVVATSQADSTKTATATVTVNAPPPPPAPSGTPPAGAIVVSTVGHAGTVADPYDGAAIQTAINAAQSGATVYIPAGNWLLPNTVLRGGDTNHIGVIVQNKANITIQGAGSGNTFNNYGQPTYTATPQGSYTRIFSPSTANRQLNIYTGASNVTVRDIFFDGFSQAANSNAWQGILVTEDAGSGITFKNIRVTQNQGTEGQAQSFSTAGITWDSCVFVNTYANMNGLLQTNGSDHTTIRNSLFKNNTWNPIADSYDLMDGSVTLCGSSNAICGVGFCNTSTGNTIRNSYFDGSGSSTLNKQGMPIGVGVNDPGTGGTVSNTTITGNWIAGNMNTATISGSEWLMYYGYTGGANGMTVNGFTITNNSLIANGEASIDLRGTPSGSAPNDGCPAYVECHHVSNATAHFNYLSAPTRQLYTDSFTDSYAAGNNAGVDVSLTAANTPTVTTFALGTASGLVVPVAMAGQTTYGAVMYLINESGTTPTGSDPSWVYVPPVSWTRSSTSVTTLYAWTKSAAGAISTRASAQVP